MVNQEIIDKEDQFVDGSDGIVEDDDAPNFAPSAVARYAKTRFTTLLKLHTENLADLNPFPALKDMSFYNWNMFFLGMLAWFSASFDFFLTSVSGTYIAASLDVSTADITWGLSAVLMVRSAGAVIFGLWTDNYSRKWPYITCCFLFMALQIGTGFVTTYQQFLAVRALSGVAMGGTYATAAATSLDDAPVRARSFLSGLFFTAYAWGLAMAAVFWRAFLGTPQTWKSLFWFSSGIPFVLICWRLLLPETKYFQRTLKARKLIIQDKIDAGTYIKPTTKSKFVNAWGLCKKYWLLFIYLILLMAGCNFLTHASQDMFPTMLRSQLGYSEDAVVVGIVIANLGGVAGSIIIGLFMEVLGRRLSIIICCIAGGCFIYPAFMLQTDSAVLGAGFMLFFCVLGVWGVIPAHLSELSPPDARVFVSGLAYQLGNLASSASSTIETRIADIWPITYEEAGKVTHTYDYAKTMACFTGAVFIYTLVCALVGHEKFHRDLSSPVMKEYIKKVVDMEHDNVESHSTTPESASAKHELSHDSDGQ